MANEDVLGPRKTMFVLVIVVGCFAVLWPRILSPLILGTTRDQLKPNKFDREAGCCEVMFEAEVAALELVNEVCNSAIHIEGKLSPYAAAACRKTVNETCGLDIAAFLKRSDHVGKTTKMLLQAMKNSNSSCLKEHFGVPVWSVSHHPGLKSWDKEDLVKQERPPIRGMGPHPALRERGRAIPAGAPTPPSRGPVPLPPHIRVRTSPLSGYFELDIKPPPIPGMRPPLGSPGGPAPTPKTSMGFVMPIYTICIIVFFVYTLSKIIFKRTGTVPYESISPDPQFRRRVFRDDSQTSPDKLGHKERDTIVSAISGLVAEVQQQMEASYAQSQQRQNGQDNARPYTNGTVIHNTGPVHIVASEYREAFKEASPEIKEPSVEREKTRSESPKEDSVEPKGATFEPVEDIPESKEVTPEPVEKISESKETSPAFKEESPEHKDLSPESKEPSLDRDLEDYLKVMDHKGPNGNLVNLDDDIESDAARLAEEFLQEELRIEASNMEKEKQSTPELLEEALIEEKGDEDDQENASVKVVGMETTAHSADGSAWPRDRPPPLTPQPPARPPHEADEVKEIFLSTEIPQQSRVLVAGCGEEPARRPAPKHSPAVVSGKMTLSLIQDAPTETPERELESTLDEFTTASAVTQNATKEGDQSDEEFDEEIEEEEEEEGDKAEEKGEGKGGDEGAEESKWDEEGEGKGGDEGAEEGGDESEAGDQSVEGDESEEGYEGEEGDEGEEEGEEETEVRNKTVEKQIK